MTSRITIHWTRLSALVIVAALALALAGCAGPSPTPGPDESGDASDTETHAHGDADEVNDVDSPGMAGHIEDGVKTLVDLPGGDQPPVVVNVSFDAAGISPAHVAVPANRQIQLVLRNHDLKEHHYHILGMPTLGLLWREKTGELTGQPIDETDHAAHHPDANMVPFHICTSRSGVCPTGEWVHAHADGADMDMVIFVSNVPGSYEVVDPLHPELTASFTVF